MVRAINEGRMLLAIQATQQTEPLSLRGAAQAYDVPFSTLRDRLRGSQPRARRRNNQRPLTELEEEELIRHVIDLDSQGFSP